MTGMSRKKSLLFLKQIFVFHLSLSLSFSPRVVAFFCERDGERERERNRDNDIFGHENFTNVNKLLLKKFPDDMKCLCVH